MSDKHTNNRYSNFEFLRIFAMFLIVAHHFVIHGVFSKWTYNENLLNILNSYISVFLGSFGKVGVFIFIILMGYFNCIKEFRIEKFFNIYLKTFLYSLSIFFIVSLFKTNTDISGIFPMTKNSYWFIKNYLILYLISPILNKIINTISDKMLKNITVWCIIINFIPSMINPHFNLGHLCVFITLYLTGCCYRKNIIIIKDLYLYILTLISIIAIISTSVFTIQYGEFVFTDTQKYTHMYSIITFILSFQIFTYFAKLTINNNIVNNIAKSTFGIYLIHDSNFLRKIVWGHVIDAPSLMNSYFFIIKSTFIIISVYFVCIITDKIFSFMYDKTINNLSNFANLIITKILIQLKTHIKKAT